MQSTEELDKIMTVLNESRDRFDKSTQENQHLSEIAEAQRVFFEDLTGSMIDVEDIAKRNAKADAELAAINLQTEQAQEILLELLTDPAIIKKTDVGEVLKTVISTTLSEVFQVAAKAASKGKAGIPIFDLIGIEKQVNELIQEMTDRDLYPETETASKERLNRSAAHIARLEQFLNQYMQPPSST